MFIHYMYVDIHIPLTKVIPIKFEPVTIYYQTLQTLIGHNLNASPQVLPCIFSQFNMDRP